MTRRAGVFIALAVIAVIASICASAFGAEPMYQLGAWMIALLLGGSSWYVYKHDQGPGRFY